MRHSARKEKYPARSEYDVPVLRTTIPSPSSQSVTEAFTSTDNFYDHLHVAMRDHLRSVVAKNNKKKNNKKTKKESQDNLKDELLRLERVRGLFASIDEAVGERPGVSNSFARKHDIKVIDIWRRFVEQHFDEIVALFDPPSNTVINDEDDEDDEDAHKRKEVLRSFSVPIKQVLRDDLSEEFLDCFFQTMNKTQVMATSMYQDLAAATTATALWVLKIEPNSSSTNVLQNVIPIMFKEHATIDLCNAVKWDDVLKSPSLTFETREMFSFSHIQIIASAHFGIRGVRSKTAQKYPQWQKANAELSNSAFNFAPSGLSPAVMSDVCTKLATNIKNMWKGKRKGTKALDNILEILLCLNLRPTAELVRIAKAIQGQVKRKEAALPSITKNRRRSNVQKERLLIERLTKKCRPALRTRSHCNVR